jgi:hypothetical protein
MSESQPARSAHALVRGPRRLSAEQWCTFLVVVASAGYVFSRLHPSLIFANTIPTGGDTGAHVYTPEYLRDHLLSHWRLAGWSPGWYAGFPLYVFYPVIPAVAIVALDVVLPYGIAMKLVTTAGLLSLPIAAWAAGRLANLRFPAPAALAAATIPFLFDQSFSIWGGNIQSTLAGEYSFSIALSLAVLTFGLWCHALSTGRHRALAAAALGLTWVCHPIVAIYTVPGIAAIVLVHLDKSRASLKRLRDAVFMAVIAGLLAAFWVMPFLVRHSYVSSLGFSPLPDPGQSVWHYLTPGHLHWVLGIAAFGAIGAVVERNRFGIALAIDAIVTAIVFPHFPNIGLWNARLLPFYFLCVYLLAGLGAVTLGRVLAWQLRRFDAETRRWSLIGTPVAVLGFAVVMVGLPLHALPGGHFDGTRYHWLGLSTAETSVVPGWTRLNYGGYQKQAAWPEYHGIMTTMARVGREDGCGRADYEYDLSLGRYGTPDSMMLLPYWTDGCIGSMEGLFYESSATTPYHFLTEAEVSENPANPVAGLTYDGFNLKAGVEHMRLLGVRYYMAFTPRAIKAAKQMPDQLVEVATSGPWHVYEIAGSNVVLPLAYRPAVASNTGGDWKNWLHVAAPWFAQAGDGTNTTFLTASGPDSWQRLYPGSAPTASREPGITVSDVKTTDDDVTFHVSRTGVPVLVKVSYFPNWSVSGADGPYRATPNFMIVVPTSNDVHLHYGWTGVDIGAYALSALGLLALLILARASSRTDAE